MKLQIHQKTSFKRIVLYIVLILLALISIYPFIWTITASFKTSKQLYDGNSLNLIPNPVTIQNYKDAWRYVPFGRFMLNSIIVSSFVAFMQVTIGSMAGYAFARLRFRGKKIIFILLLGTMMVPGHVTLIPNYIFMRYLNWINKYQAIMIPTIFTGICVTGMFLMRQYFLSIPKELEEAAIIDGCSRIRTYWSIILPNAKPAIATFAIISFKASWNSFMWPLIVMNDVNKMPIQVGLSFFKDTVNSNWAILLAGTTVSILPVILIFIIFQKYFVNGMVTSGFGGK